MPVYGLLGRTLSHSFSKKYFTEKFAELGLNDHKYELFELDNINDVDILRGNSELKGFNITIPYKQDIIPHLSSIDNNARKIGAVNVVKISNGNFHGYNSDFYGFRKSLKNWMGERLTSVKALVLGTGGASKAVTSALEDLSITHKLVSRRKVKGVLTYEEVSKDIIQENELIINTTPLGMSPNVEKKPDLIYDALTPKHYLYDLIYNPLETTFMTLGKLKGTHVKNGLEMLHLQAEKSWEIWTERL
ncbi:MAG: shikimate dehydrogenase [Bacteroidota bacterium]